MNHWIGKGYKSVKRYREIGDILGKYGFGFFVKKLSEANLVPKYILRKKKENLSLTTGERIRLICEELGPTFIKLGQIASTRPDLFPHDIIKELIKLQDNVKEVSSDIVKQVFKEEFKISVEEAFFHFEEKPIAAASIGQVHSARLLSGEEVIVKIQRPFIEKIVDTDINILLSMSKLFDEYFGDMIPMSMTNVMIELTKSLKHELDYSREGRNTERFRKNFENDKSIYIPEIIWSYTSKRILTQGFVKGIKVSDTKLIKEAGWNPKYIADIGARSFLKQVFIYGFFHGDPHPGNIIVLNNSTISYIDFGICGYLDKTTVELITNMFIAGGKKDVDRVADLLEQIDSITERTNIRRFKEDLLFLMSHYYDMPLKKINVTQLVSEFMRIIYENHIKLPSQFTLLIKAVITVEGTGRILNPDFSLSAIMKDVTGDIIKNKFTLSKLLDNANNFTQELFYGITTLPKEIRSIIKTLEKNQVKITLDEIKIKDLGYELNKTGNIIALSMIVSSLVIGSSLALNIEKAPKVFSLPVISFVGYLTAIILGIITLTSIFFSNSKKS